MDLVRRGGQLLLFLAAAALLLLLEGARTAADVELDRAEGVLVPPDCGLECHKQTLGGVEVHDGSLADLHGLGSEREWLRVQAKVEDHFFRRGGHSTEVRVARLDPGEVDRDLGLGGVGDVLLVGANGPAFSQ